MDEETARKVTLALNEPGDLIESALAADALNRLFPEWEWTLWSDGDRDADTMKKDGWLSAREGEEGEDKWCVWEIVYRPAHKSKADGGTEDA